MSKTRKRSVARDDLPSGGEVRLVYARPTPNDGEPLVAIVRTEREACLLEAQIGERHPTTRVMWETHTVKGAPVHTVHSVLLEAGDDHIGIAAFASLDDAQKARDALAEEGMTYTVVSLPLNWRRSGWPFGPTTPVSHTL